METLGVPIGYQEGRGHGWPALPVASRRGCGVCPSCNGCRITQMAAFVSFLHRFGSALTHHVHLHACVTDGVFMPIDDEAPDSFWRRREGESAG